MSKEEKIVTERYYVDGTVCDYGVFDRLSCEEENKLVCICNSHKNALTIAEILNTDYYPDEKGFVAVWKDKQLAELKAKNEMLKENNKSQLVKLYDDENKKLKQQLKEKDEEIAQMKLNSDKNLDYLEEFASMIDNEKDCNTMLKAIDNVRTGRKFIVNEFNIEQALKSNTKQVCEKIREYLDKNKHFEWDTATSSYTGDYFMYIREVKEFLDQIEKGEKDGN